ncbi:MAG: DNA translocase FtsK [Candidatus Yonathbacteria bacterium]|nr:DNA translocase FtsK [Candidatus Yonathbacteria bacterium]
MAKKRVKSEVKNGFFRDLKEETRHSVFAIIFFALAIFFVLSAWSKSGVVGAYTFKILETLLGLGFFLLPLILGILGVSFLRSIRPELVVAKAIGAILFFLSGLGLTAILFKDNSGGIIGSFVASPLVKFFDIYVSLLFLVALAAISLLLIFDAKLHIKPISFTLFKKKIREEDDDMSEDNEDDDDEEEEDDEDEEDEEEPSSQEKKGFGLFGGGKGKKESEEEKGEGLKHDDEDQMELRNLSRHIAYTPPPLSLLDRDKGKPDVGDIKANANIIKRTLQNFGITVEMDEITVGPSVTRYALKPAEGVKLSRIVGLQNDLGLALAAHPIRIEAPIPGKSLVGIEVPNHARSTVGLSGLVSSPEFVDSPKPLLVTLGKSVSGKSTLADLARLPHVLIAGTTGSGKSVTIHAIITSLLYRNSPENLRFIMIDPKRVELTLYNKIPHLLTPVITDAKKAILALKWAAKEMDRRYDVLEAESVRDIASYHKNTVIPAYAELEKNANALDIEESKLPEAMPYIVIVIDELADIMTSYPRELESAIVRLAQMSRAVGIHLVLSTQRPSVNVITGLIKANIPGRIALQVSSQIDSRTILDTGGAEKLLGSGDMLYMSGEMSQPKRLQSAFVSEAEVKKIVKFLTKQYEDEIPDEINFTAETAEKNSLFDIMNADTGSADEDALYEEAYETVVGAGKASTSYLQRKLKVGYSRAARLMDMLEDHGVIGPADGSKPRDVIQRDNEEGYGEREG